MPTFHPWCHAVVSPTPAPPLLSPPPRYSALLPKTAALLYLSHFNGLIAGECEDSLGMLAGLAADGVPPHMLHRLALQMAGIGFGSPSSRFDVRAPATVPQPSRPASSPAAVRCAIAALREASGGSWSDAVGAWLSGRLANVKQVRRGGLLSTHRGKGSWQYVPGRGPRQKQHSTNARDNPLAPAERPVPQRRQQQHPAGRWLGGVGDRLSTALSFGLGSKRTADTPIECRLSKPQRLFRSSVAVGPNSDVGYSPGICCSSPRTRSPFRCNS